MTEATITGCVEAHTGRVPSFELAIVREAAVRRLPLPANGVITLGRGAEAAVQLEDERVSRVHLMLHCGPTMFVEDLGSRNGTTVSGAPLSPGERRALLAGDEVQVGPFRLSVQRTIEAPPGRSPEELEALVDAQLKRRGPAAVARIAIAVVHDRLALWAELHRRLELTEGFASQPGFVDVALFDEERTLTSRLEALARALMTWADVEGSSVVSAAPGSTASELFAALRRRHLSAPPSAFVPKSAAMKTCWLELERAAPTTMTVLLIGETGSGKEVCARRVHELSRRGGALVAINCAAVAATLIESELFGYERGAFTGALSAKPGLIEAADGGTCFLDEIGELPFELQAKLLRVLERKEVQRVGSVKPKQIDVRFVAATNRDLKAEVKARRFREDLYFRLSGLTIDVPPLRRRTEDLAPLADFLVDQLCTEAKLPLRRLSDEARALIRSAAWPGNVRELKNVLERALVMTRGPLLEASDLKIVVTPLAIDSPAVEGLDPEQAAERQRILDALAATAGNQSHAAERLGISRSTLVARIKQYNIPRPRR